MSPSTESAAPSAGPEGPVQVGAQGDQKAQGTERGAPPVPGRPPSILATPFRMMRGFLGPIGAVAFIAKHPATLAYFVIPAAINMLLFVGLLVLLVTPATHVLSTAAGAAGFTHILVSIAGWMLWIAVAIGLSLVCVTVLGNLVAYPFNARLSAHIIEIVTGVKPPHGSLSEAFASLPAELLGQLKTWLLWALAMAFVIAFHAVPIIGPLLGTPVGIAVSAWFFGLEYLAYPMSAQGYPAAPILGYTRGHKAEAIGLGLWMFLTVLFLGWVMMPLCVAGATLVYLEDPLCPMRDA